jgi:hypothetical protein
VTNVNQRMSRRSRSLSVPQRVAHADPLPPLRHHVARGGEPARTRLTETWNHRAGAVPRSGAAVLL